MMHRQNFQAEFEFSNWKLFEFNSKIPFILYPLYTVLKAFYTDDYPEGY